jgi:hypothetical protein
MKLTRRSACYLPRSDLAGTKRESIVLDYSRIGVNRVTKYARSNLDLCQDHSLKSCDRYAMVSRVPELPLEEYRAKLPTGDPFPTAGSRMAKESHGAIQ